MVEEMKVELSGGKFDGLRIMAEMGKYQIYIAEPLPVPSKVQDDTEVKPRVHVYGVDHDGAEGQRVFKYLGMRDV